MFTEVTSTQNLPTPRAPGGVQRRTGAVRWNLLYPSGVRILSVDKGQIILDSKDKVGPFDLDGRRIGKQP
jgi:hypothetical protein